MEQEKVGSLSLPGVGFGTLGNQGSEGIEFIEAALAEGYRYLDTARYYGNEDAVGEAIRRSSVRRDEIVITTKLLHPRTLPMSDLQAEVVKSMDSLRTDYIDLLLIHWPSPTVSLEWAVEEISAMRDQGVIREYGVSNFPVDLVGEVESLTDDVVVNQVEYHPYLGQGRLLDSLRSSGIVLTAHTPLARGAVNDDPALQSIAHAKGLSAAQVALRWLVQQEGVVAIPGAATVEQLRQNLGVLSISLSKQEMSVVAGLDRGTRMVDPPHAPKWDPPDKVQLDSCGRSVPDSDIIQPGSMCE